MKLKATFFMLLTLLLTVTGFSQGIKIAYNGSILYSGAKVGYEVPYRSVEVNKIRKSGKIRSFSIQSLLSSNLGYYHHQGFHDNLYVTVGWAQRRTFSKGFFIEFTPEAGISRTFLGGTTYRVGEEGKITIASSSGYFYPLLSLGGGCGYDFSKRDNTKPIMAYFKLNALGMYPYNSTLYLRPAFEVGVIYKLKSLTR